MNLSGGEIFQSLGQLFEKNGNLSELEVEDCYFGGGGVSHFSMALRGCNKSLKSVKITNNQMGDEWLVEIIDALSVHPQLETLALEWMNIGRNECAALANVLNSTMAALQELSLFNNAIDDEGVDILAGALTNSRLRVLNLHNNVSITAGGCQSLAVLLEHPNSDLEKLHLVNNNIGNEGAKILANALANNRKLKLLYLSSNGITADGPAS
jgi:Ran GTPase-activating protein (RanGAP) involved in mRNA processing and transport